MDFKNFYKQIKERPTPAREFKADIAAACGVTVGTVERWLAGEIIPEKLKRDKISEVLEIPVEELFPDLQSVEL